KQNSKESIKIIGQRAYKYSIGRFIEIRHLSLCIGDKTNHSPNPGTYQGYRCYRSCRSIHQVGKLGARDAQPISKGTHGVAYYHGVGIIIKEDDKAHERCHQLPVHFGANKARNTFDNSACTAIVGNNSHHSTNKHRKDNDTHMAYIGRSGDDIVAKRGEEAAEYAAQR